MDKANLRLSPNEAELMLNADWILTKNAILTKIKTALEHLQSRQQELLKNIHPNLPAEVSVISPKVSKGENYRGLPYLILDYPRFFAGADHFAIRSLFWWGNFFSITLHLSGRYKSMYEGAILSSFSSIKEEEFFICTNEDPWEHHFEGGNYVRADEMDISGFKKTIGNRDFIKLAKRFPLEEWDTIEERLMTSYCKMANWLKG
jgi:hypothetical protein